MPPASGNRSFEALTFALSGEIFAVDAYMVREILDIIPVTEVPGAQDFVPGLINVRGRVVPLADLRVKFGMEVAAISPDTRIVVVEMELFGEATIVGLLADKVYEVAELTEAAIEDPPAIGMKWRPDFIKGVGKHGNDFIFIPAIEHIFAAG